MVICAARMQIYFIVLMFGNCAEPVRLTDPKLIEIERFVNACAGNEMASVIAMVKKGMKVNSRNFNFEKTCLHHAAYNGNLPLVEFLLENGAFVTVKDQNDRTPLFDAIYVARNNKPPSWNSRVVNTLLAHGAQPTINTPAHGGTPLYWACRLHNPEIVKLLLDYGADPSFNDDGRFWAYRCVQRRLEGHDEEKQKAREIWALLKAKGAKEPL